MTKTGPLGALAEHVDCPRCLAANDASGIFCSQCGWNLAIAPEEARGRRVPALMAGILLLVVVAVLVLWDRAPSSEPEAPVVAETTMPEQEPSVLVVAAVSARSARDEGGLERLVDGDRESVWYTTFVADDAPELTVRFPRAVRIQEIALRHMVEGPAFFGHARVARIEIAAGTSVQAVDLVDVPGEQTVQVQPFEARSFILRIVDTYFTGESNSGPPVDELAVAELTFVGTEPTQGG